MSEIGAHGLKVLEAIAEGREFRPSGDGWRAGVLSAPGALVAELRQRDFVREGGGGRLLLTRKGLAHHQRRHQPAGRRPQRLLAERAVHADGEERKVVKGRARHVRSVTVNMLESPLGWLKARGMISERQFAAGERLRGDWTLAGLSPRVTMRWDAAPSAKGARGPAERLDPTEARLAARRRFDGAVAAVGDGLADILWRVVCSGEGLSDAETALGWPQRSGKLVLCLALDRVADFYGER